MCSRIRIGRSCSCTPNSKCSTNRYVGSCAFTRCWRRTSPVLAPATPGRALKSAASKLMHAQRAERSPGYGMQHRFLSPLGRLRRLQRWLAGSDATISKWTGSSATAEKGNIALTGEIDLPDSGEFTIAVAFGGSYQSTAAKLLQSLAEPFESHRQRVCPPVAARGGESQIRFQQRHVRRRRRCIG